MYIHSNQFMWDEEKNLLLKRTRGVGFEDVIEAIEQGSILDDYIHHDQMTHP